MVDWTTLLTVVIGALIGGGITLGGTEIQGRHTRKALQVQVDTDRRIHRAQWDREDERLTREKRQAAFTQLARALAEQFQAILATREQESEFSALLHDATTRVIESVVTASAFADTFDATEAQALSALVTVSEQANRTGGSHAANRDGTWQAAELLQDLRTRLQPRIADAA